MHFSELFKIKMGEIVPRFKLSFGSSGISPEQNSVIQNLDGTIDLSKHTNSYFDVILNNGIHMITKIHQS